MSDCIAGHGMLHLHEGGCVEAFSVAAGHEPGRAYDNRIQQDGQQHESHPEHGM